MQSGDLCCIVGMYWVEVGRERFFRLDVYNRPRTSGKWPSGPCIWLSRETVGTSAGTVVPCGWIMKPDGSVVRIPMESLRECLELVIFSPRSVWIRRSTR